MNGPFQRPDPSQVNPLGLLAWTREQAEYSAQRNSQRMQRGKLSVHLAEKDARYWQRLMQLAAIDAGQAPQHGQKAA